MIAVPGCYPTASLLGILPLIDHIKPESKIILDVKSGISGAGRNAVENSLENDLQNNFKAYSPEFHRHQPEIKNFLSSKKGTVNEIIFTPHLGIACQWAAVDAHLSYLSYCFHFQCFLLSLH